MSTSIVLGSLFFLVVIMVAVFISRHGGGEDNKTVRYKFKEDKDFVKTYNPMDHM